MSTDLQTAGRGRQGRGWTGLPGAIAISVVLREFIDDLLTVRAGLAVARIAGPRAQIKWPNDVLIDGRKVAGILAETEAGSDWAVLGIGINAAVDASALPDDIAARAGSLGRAADELPALRLQLLRELDAALRLSVAETIAAVAPRDALVGRPVRWEGGDGIAAGVEPDGRLRVRLASGSEQLLRAGEVHLL